MKKKRRKNSLFTYKNSKAFEELKKMSKDKNELDDEYSDDENRILLTSKIEFNKELEQNIREILIKIFKYSLFIIFSELVLLTIFKLWDTVIGLFLGFIAAFLGLLLLVKSYKSYDIISVGIFKMPKMYSLRYIFYAVVFLLSAILSKDPFWGIVGTFIGMMNLKIVIFFFSWRW